MAKLIDCECGYVVSGDTDADLVERAERHIEETHPDWSASIRARTYLRWPRKQSVPAARSQEVGLMGVERGERMRSAATVRARGPFGAVIWVAVPGRGGRERAGRHPADGKQRSECRQQLTPAHRGASEHGGDPVKVDHPLRDGDLRDARTVVVVKPTRATPDPDRHVTVTVVATAYGGRATPRNPNPNGDSHDDATAAA